MTNLISYVEVWIIFVVVVLALALYRKFVSTRGDNYVHMSEGGARLIPHQIAVNRKIDKIDHWGEFLTIVALVAGLGLACMYLYSALNAR